MAHKYRIGSIIQYNIYGTGEDELRTVLVDEKSRNIKNGRPGFGGDCCDQVNGKWVPNKAASVWGYDDQITRVLQL